MLLKWFSYFRPFCIDGSQCRGLAFPDVLLAIAPLRWLVAFLDSTARTTAVILGASTLYRTAVRTRFEFFSSGCLGL